MTVVIKIENGEYKSKVKYPSRVNEKEVRSKVYESFVGTYAQIEEEAKKQIAIAIEKNHAEMNAYRKSEDDGLKQFKEDLAEEFGVSSHPKKDKLYSLAWEYGHSSGLMEVYNYYSELVELLV